MMKISEDNVKQASQSTNMFSPSSENSSDRDFMKRGTSIADSISADFSVDNASVISDLTSTEDSSTAFSSRLSRKMSKRQGSVRDAPKALKSSVLSRKLSSDPSAIAMLKFHKLGLIGREEESKVIRDTLEEITAKEDEDGATVAPQYSKAVVQIQGPSGVGKTFLATKTLEAFAKHHDVLVGSGKFDLNAAENNSGSMEPLSALKSAIRQIATQIQDETPKKYEEVMEELTELNADPILESWLPEFSFPKKREDKSSDGGSTLATQEVSLQQVEYATKKFLSKVVRDDKPTVILIDDAQWSDAATNKLLKSWLFEEGLSAFMVVLCYRDNSEMIKDGSHSMHTDFLKPLQECQDDAKAKVTDTITLQPLTLEHTHQFICQVLNSSEIDTKELSELSHRKTNGNPFHLMSFLQALQDKSLITFHLGLTQWRWDMETLKKETIVTQNVVDLLRDKLLKSKEAGSVLPVAAILGCTFSTSTLATIFTAFQGHQETANHLGLLAIPQSNDELTAWLSVCKLDGFLDPIPSENSDEQMFCFVHDQVQEAALRLLEPARLSLLQFRIGNALVRDLLDSDNNVKEDVRPHLVFTAANLVNVGSDAVDVSSRFDILDAVIANVESPVAAVDNAVALGHLHINLAAGDLAMSTASFAKAAEYYNFAMLDCPPHCWETMPQLAAATHNKAAFAEYSIGNHEDMEDICEMVLSQPGLTLMDKFPSYTTLLQSNTARERNQEALKMGLEVLQKFGIRFPKSKMNLTMRTLSSLFKAKGLAKKLKETDIETLPVVTDPEVIAIAETLYLTTAAAYMAGPELIALLIVEQVFQTLKHGISQHSQVAFANLGLILGAGFEDFDAVKQSYYHSKTVQRCHPFKETEARLLCVLHMYCYPWFLPQQNTLPPLVEGYNRGLAAGDIETASYCLMFHVEVALYVSRPLHLIDEDCRVYSAQLRNYSQMKQRRAILNCWQACRNLRGMGENTSTLSGDIMDIEREEQFLDENNDSQMKLVLYRLAVFLAMAMGDYQKCADLAMVWTDAMVKNIPGQGVNMQMRFYAALSGLIMAQTEKRKSLKGKYKKLGMKNAAIIHKWTKKGNPNSVHMESFLDAEKQRLKKNYAMAIKNYEYAIVLCGRRGLLFEQAAASERYANLLFEMKKNHDGVERLKEAVKWYQEWGASGKAYLLENVLNERMNETDGGAGGSSFILFPSPVKK